MPKAILLFNHSTNISKCDAVFLGTGDIEMTKTVKFLTLHSLQSGQTNNEQ